MIIEQKEQEYFPSIERIPLAYVDAAQVERMGKPPGYCEDAWAAEGNWAAIADGMGGRRQAHDAAYRVLDFYAYAMRSVPDGALKSVADVKVSTQASFEEINSLIQQEYPGTGTTLSTVSAWHTSEGDKWVITWVGDSRVYVVREEGVTRLTYDLGQDTEDFEETNIPSLLDEVDKIRTKRQFKKASHDAQHILRARLDKYAGYYLGNYFGTTLDHKLFAVRNVVVEARPEEALLLITDGVSDNLDPDTIYEYAYDAEALVQKAREVSISGEFRSVPDDMTACRTSI